MEALTVSQATSAIKRLLEGQFRLLSVQGEVSNLKNHSSGHLYFSLKDPHAQISCVLFAREAGLLQRTLKDGDKVIVQANLTVYEPHGAYKLIVKELHYVGVGELLLQLEALKKKLQALGWFDRSRKRPLPKFPKRIGVVTSPTGAVIQDIIHVLNRRVGTFQLLLNPVKVQGEGAALEIAQAIEEMNRYNLVDVLIVGRGGGSLEDLWAFNEEIVAKAIVESRIPVISAVGHESDYSLSDAVADLRAPTPSAAAEMVMAETAQQHTFLQQMQQRLRNHLLLLLRGAKERLRGFMRDPLLATPYLIVQQRAIALDELSTKLETLLQQRLQKETNQITQISQQLALINPQTLLKRGYALLFSEKERSLIRSVQEAETGESLIAQLSDGQLVLTVEKTL